MLILCVVEYEFYKIAKEIGNSIAKLWEVKTHSPKSIDAVFGS